MARVSRAMTDGALDGLLVTSAENIHYLTGLDFQGWFAFTLLVVTADGDLTIVCRAMERATIQQQVPDVAHVGFSDDEDAAEVTVRVLGSLGLADATVGIDLSSAYLRAAIWQGLRSGLPHVAWVDTSVGDQASRYPVGLLDHIRLVKSSAEIERMRTAAEIGDIAIAAGLGTAGVGVNEKEVAAAVYAAMVGAGGEYPGFAPLIRSTETLHQEHSTWRDRPLGEAEALVIEIAGCKARYHAPQTQMRWLGGAPAGAEQSLRVSAAGLRAVLDALRPGTTTTSVYDRWQATIDEGLGHTRLRRHHCGYAVGLGFPPSWVGSSSVLGIRRRPSLTIESGMSFHVLSWITDDDLPPYFASDTVVVGPDGAEVLTRTPHELLL